MQAFDNLRNFATKILSDRPILARTTRTFEGIEGFNFTARNRYDILTTSGWLFACVDLIASAMADAEWTLTRMQSNGDQTLVAAHPVRDVWQQPNPTMTRYEFVQTSVNHFEIAGEIFWLVIRGVPGGPPLELWPIRPDRMTVVPAPTGEIQGYIYRIGNERIPLEPEDVIFTKRPNPNSAYRGMGVIESILVDLSADDQASRWSRNFYVNGALPGGIIKLEESLSERDWELFVDRWRQQHQGVQNAHKIAVIERAEFQSMRFNQSDMQFLDGRKLSRDIILEAFRIPKSMIGIIENVVANAETGERIFAQNVVKPRLEMVKQSANMRLVPLVAGSANLALDYKDPAPANKELDTKTAISGYRGQILTLNEARDLLGVAALPDGDNILELAPTGGRDATQLTELSVSQPQKALLTVTRALPGQDDVNDASDDMRDAWEKRLTQEVNALIAHLEAREGSTTLAGWAMTKFSPGDVESYDWDWIEKHAADVEDELVAVFFDAISSEFADIEPSEAQRLSGEYARNRGAELLKLEGDLSVTARTRQKVRDLTADAIERGDSLGQLAKQLREDPIFSPERARLIARTETATALGQGERRASLLQGRNEKRWVTQGDDHVDAGQIIQQCVDNEAAGWIPINEAFPSGHMTIPTHPNCRCRVRSRTRTDEDRSIVRVHEVRCPNCSKLLGMDKIKGESEWCPRCKKEQVVS